MSNQTVGFQIGPKTKYIISTSGRISSLQRYQKLLQEILKLDVAYIPIHTGDDQNPHIDPQRFTQTLKGLPCIGGAISKDIKGSIIPFLDEIDSSAVAVQSVNTVIVNSDLTLKGYNTDVIGFSEAIQQGIKDSGVTVSTAVCYGYGGVASVVTNVLKGFGIKVYLIGRNKETAINRAKDLNVEAWNGEVVDLFVNATPASEHPLEQAANLLESLSSAKIVFDHEMPGKYLKEYCEAKGVYHIKGTAMYYPQMKAQWSLFLQAYLSPSSDLEQLLKDAEK